jgi:hypothetical protein
MNSREENCFPPYAPLPSCFANHAPPFHQAPRGMLFHPLGELRRAHQAGLHRNVGEVRRDDDLLVTTCRRGDTAERCDDLDHEGKPTSPRWAMIRRLIALVVKTGHFRFGSWSCKNTFPGKAVRSQERFGLGPRSRPLTAWSRRFSWPLSGYRPGPREPSRRLLLEAFWRGSVSLPCEPS